MKTCEICNKEFKPKSYSDKYCGKLCLNASITDKEQEHAIQRFRNEQENCPICGRNKKFLVHKRMNGYWYLYQIYHYNNNKDSIKTCYNCNLWEMFYRRRTGNHITPNEHKNLIRT